MTKQLMAVNLAVADQRVVCRMLYQAARAMVEAAATASALTRSVVRQTR